MAGIDRIRKPVRRRIIFERTSTAQFSGSRWKWAAGAVGVLAAWVALDLSMPVRHDLRRFDGEEVGRLEAGM